MFTVAELPISEDPARGITGKTFDQLQEMSKGLLTLKKLSRIMEQGRVTGLIAMYQCTARADDRLVENIKEGLHHMGAGVKVYLAREV